MSDAEGKTDCASKINPATIRSTIMKTFTVRKDRETIYD